MSARPGVVSPEAGGVPKELETLLRLVAEGKLTPDEASPIIDALTRAERAASMDRDDEQFPRIAGLDRLGERIHRRVQRRVERAHRQAARAQERVEKRLAGAGVQEEVAGHRARQLRIRVTERGRQVVNLRIPIGFVETALQFVPGLGGDQTERIRTAVQAGAIGPILDVEEEDGSGVLISVE